MKTFILITSLLAVSLHAIQLDPKTSIKDRVDLNRFSIIVKGKFGFINSSGDVVIPPRFESVQGFSEGLCAVR